VKNVLVGIGGLIVGALIVILAVPPKLFVSQALPACFGQRNCIEVSVIKVGDSLKIQDIGNFELRKGETEITWRIATPGYTFPANAITFVDKPDFPLPAQNEFKCESGGGKTYKCEGRHVKPGTYGYKISLDGTPAVPPLDPFIIND
jgi:hypothetical protein